MMIKTWILASVSILLLLSTAATEEEDTHWWNTFQNYKHASHKNKTEDELFNLHKDWLSFACVRVCLHSCDPCMLFL